jgi:hypothetical protein
MARWPQHLRNHFCEGRDSPRSGFLVVDSVRPGPFLLSECSGAILAGHQDKNLKYNADGSLTLYAGAKSPGADRESNWLPAPEGTFSLYIRAYWADKAILDGT